MAENRCYDADCADEDCHNPQHYNYICFNPKCEEIHCTDSNHYDKQLLRDYQENSDLIFYEPINDKNNDIEIYQLSSNNFDLDNFINNKLNNYRKLSSEITIIEPEKSYIFLLKCKNECLYMKYINQYLLFEYTIDESEIVYLFMDLIYQIKYNENFIKIKNKKIE